MTPPGFRRQWRWFHQPGSARLVAKEEFDALPVHGRAALVELMKRWSGGGTVWPHEVKKLKGTDGLWELRVNVGNDPFRLIFFQDSPVHDVIVLATYKNQQKLPASDLTLAKRRRDVWRDQGRRPR